MLGIMIPTANRSLLRRTTADPMTTTGGHTMSTPDRDELKEKAKEAAGKAKQQAGDWADDEKMEAEGKLEEAEGEVQQKSGDQKRQPGEPVEDVRERIRQSQPRQVR
jgi:uncharacterized protein YjbJ (UPF0337 family)